MALRLVIADDEPLVRAGIAMLLRPETDIEVVGEAGDGIEAVELARAAAADVVIMDVRMPRLDGVEATRRLVADAPAGAEIVKVLVLTTYHVDEAVYAALRAGASGFLLKDTAPNEIVAAVRAVGNGDGWLHPAVTRQLIDEFAVRPAPPPAAGPALDSLTPRETEVLVLVAHGFTNAQIMAQLTVSEPTVKTHVNRLIMKLGAASRAQLVTFAFHAGLVQPGSPPPG